MIAAARGYISIYGYSITGVGSAIGHGVLDLTNSKRPLVDQMNGMFESVNITVFNWIVQNYDYLNASAGSYLIRPISVLIPRSVWPDRPISFSSVLGFQLSGNPFLALNSTLFGEPYGNSAIFWPLLLGPVIVGYDALYRFLGRRFSSFGPIGAVVAIAFWRFDSSFAAVCAMFSVFLFLVFALVIGKRNAVLVPERS